MARILSQALVGGLRTTIGGQSAPLFLSSRLLALRARSSRPEKVPPPPPADPAEEGSSPAAAEVELVEMRRFHDAMHAVMARRAAPDWLPFLPGSSYWVPPRRRSRRRQHLGAVELIETIAASSVMNEEEVLCFSTSRGWPSSTYFVEGVSSHPVEPIAEKPTAKVDEEEG